MIEMYKLKYKSQKKEKELTPKERIQWLLDFKGDWIKVELMRNGVDDIKELD